MSLLLLPVALTTAGAAAIINFWLALRIVRIRRAQRISVGDGGNALLAARMRAQSNFVEYAPIILILIALIELASGTTIWLWGASILFTASRIFHVFGMDGWMPGRMIGAAVTFTLLLALAAGAVAISFG